MLKVLAIASQQTPPYRHITAYYFRYHTCRRMTTVPDAYARSAPNFPIMIKGWNVKTAMFIKPNLVSQEVRSAHQSVHHLVVDNVWRGTCLCLVRGTSEGRSKLRLADKRIRIARRAKEVQRGDG